MYCAKIYRSLRGKLGKSLKRGDRGGRGCHASEGIESCPARHAEVGQRRELTLSTLRTTSKETKSPRRPLPRYYFSATGFLASSTIFSKRGSPRNGSQNGISFN